MYISTSFEFVLCLIFIFKNAFITAQSQVGKDNVFTLWAGQHMMGNRQMEELKTMMAALDSKMTALDNRLSDLNLLEYAVKINNVDGHLSMIKQSITGLDRRLVTLETQTDDIKEMLSEMYSRQTLNEKGVVQSGNTNLRPAGDQVLCRNLKEKVEDFGYKISKSQQDIQNDTRKVQQSLNFMLETMRNGFTKTFQKVEGFPNVQRQLTQISTTVLEIPRAVERLTDISNQVARIQSNMSSSEGINKPNDRMFSSVSYAIDLGSKVKNDLLKLTEIESDIMTASKLSKYLLTGQTRRPTTSDMLKNLTNVIEKIETIVKPLFDSIPYNFDGIQELLETSLNNAPNRQNGECNFQDVFQIELRRIESSIENLRCDKSTASSNTDELEISEHGTGDDNLPRSRRQQEVLENVSFIKAAAGLVGTDLQKIFQNCPDGSVTTRKPAELVVGK